MGMLEEVGSFLQTRSLATALVPATNLFYGERPDAPDDCVTLYEYSGGEPEFDIDSKVPEWESPRLQVVARSADPQTAQGLARSVYLALSAVARSGNQDLFADPALRTTTTTYRLMKPLQQPFQMGRDENRRWLWAVNFQITRRPQTN